MFLYLSVCNRIRPKWCAVVNGNNVIFGIQVQRNEFLSNVQEGVSLKTYVIACNTAVLQSP